MGEQTIQPQHNNKYIVQFAGEKEKIHKYPWIHSVNQTLTNMTHNRELFQKRVNERTDKHHMEKIINPT
jgi:hypothetical protein